MRRDGLAASGPLVSEWGHHIPPHPSVHGADVASALWLQGEEGERAGDESLPQVVY